MTKESTGRAVPGVLAALEVNPGGRQLIVFDYTLPSSVALRGAYRLTWLRQVGGAAGLAQRGGRGQIAEGDPKHRFFEVEAALGPNRVLEFLRSRWGKKAGRSQPIRDHSGWRGEPRCRTLKR